MALQLITGASGVLGGALIPTLPSEDTVGVDRQAPRSNGLNRHLEGDLSCARFVRNVITAERPTRIIHLAALSTVQEAQSNPRQLVLDNLTTIRNLIRAIEESGIRPHVIFASSREVYGNTDFPVTENQECHPLNLYGLSKLKGEALWRKASIRLRFRLSILRFANLYGTPNDKPSRFIPQVLKCAKEGIPLNLFGGDQQLDFLHIDDAVQALLHACNNPPHPCEARILNIATGVSHSLQSVIHIARQHANIQVNHQASLRHTPHRYLADIQASRSVLGFEPKVSLPEGIQRLFNYKEILA